MDILFLQPIAAPPDGAAALNGDGALLRELRDTLRQLKGLLHTVLVDSRSNRKEARQWLINSIAALDLEEPATKRRRFTRYLPGGAACRGAEHQAVAQGMVQLLFEVAPAEVGALLARDASLLRHFFKADPKRVPLWFGHFSMEGMRRFKHGAAALAQYALINRAEVWQLLEWQGRHSQAPVAVAQRPHYFCELDVTRTIRNLVRDCPDFWASAELRQSVEEGAEQLLALDPAFWGKELLRWLADRQSQRGDQLYALLCRCLEAGPWRQHCQRLLQLLPQQDVLPFATDLLGSTPFPRSSSGSSSRHAEAAAEAARGGDGLLTGIGAAATGGGPAQAGAWLVFRSVRWQSQEQLLLVAALGCCLPQLLRLLRDDELADERAEVATLVHRLLLPQQSDQQQQQQQQQAPLGLRTAAAHWRLRQQLQQQGAGVAEVELHEMLLLHLFAAAFLVQQLSSSGSRKDVEQLQQLLSASGLSCQLAPPASRESAGKHRRRSPSSKSNRRREEKKRSRKSKSEKAKKRHKKSRRRRHSYSSSDAESDSSGSSSDSEGSGSGGRSRMGRDADAFAGSNEADPWEWDETRAAAEAGGILQQQQLWRLGPSQGGPAAGTAALSSLELLDAVISATAAAYASWLFGRRSLGPAAAGGR